MDLDVQLGNNPKFCSLLSVRLKQDLSGVNLLKCTENTFWTVFYVSLRHRNLKIKKGTINWSFCFLLKGKLYSS